MGTPRGNQRTIGSAALTAVVLASQLACALSQDQTLERTNAIRELVYAQIDVAANRSLLRDPPWDGSVADVLDAFQRDEAGVWCGGTTQALYMAYREAGFDAWTLSYGVEGLVTHAINLVEVDGVVYGQDAYFNRYYPRPFFEVLETLASGRPVVALEGAARFRDVHLGSEDEVSRSWTTRMAEPGEIACRDREQGGLTCRSDTSVGAFAASHRLVVPTLDLLESDGYPRDLDFLLLYPFAVAGPDGYVTKPDSSQNDGLLGRIRAVTGRLGG